MEAARRGARPALRRRFYDKAATAAGSADGYAVRLDDKPVRTPARRVLAAPTLPLAQAIAAEWQAQRDVIDPAKMPLTRLANAIIDGVADRPRPGRGGDRKIPCLRSVVLPCRQPAEDWLRASGAIGTRCCPGRAKRLARASMLAEGIIHVAQPRGRAGGRPRRHPERSLAARRGACGDDADRLGAHCARPGARALVGRGGVAGGAMSMRTGIWSNGAATSWRWSAGRSASPSWRRRRRCCICSRGEFLSAHSRASGNQIFGRHLI